MGLRKAASSAPAAYIGSLNSTKDLVLHLFKSDSDVDDIPDTGKALRADLQSVYQNININLASQKTLRHAIDMEALVNLKESLSLRDKVRLNTIGTPETGAWLQAVPHTLIWASPCPEKNSLYHCQCGSVVIFFLTLFVVSAARPLIVMVTMFLVAVMDHLESNAMMLSETHCLWTIKKL